MFEKTKDFIYNKRLANAKKIIKKDFSGGGSAYYNVLSLLSTGVWDAMSFQTLTREAYVKNVIAFRCIKKRATEINNIRIIATNSKGEIFPDHESLKLLKRPNNRTTQSTLLEAMVTYKALAGDAYLVSTSDDPSKPPKELYILRPDMVTPHTDGVDIINYRYQTCNGSSDYPVDKLTGSSNIMHWQNFNPLCSLDGQSIITPAQSSILIHNESQKWNQALLKNSAVPSGAFVYSDKDGERLSPDQRESTEETLREKFSGSGNAGRPMVLDGAMSWLQMSMSSKDMDFLSAKDSNARDVCISAGVPADLIMSGSTYDNRSADMQSMYEDTIIPELRSFLDQLNIWLMPRYGDDVYLDMDVSEVSALAPRRKETMEMYELSKSVTINEKRKYLSFESVDGGDDLYIETGKIPLSFVNANAQAELDAVNRIATTESDSKEKK